MDKIPEIFTRVMRFAGKQRNQVSNPCMSARECIQLADYVEYLLETSSDTEKVKNDQLRENIKEYFIRLDTLRTKNRVIDQVKLTLQEHKIKELLQDNINA